LRQLCPAQIGFVLQNTRAEALAERRTQNTVRDRLALFFQISHEDTKARRQIERYNRKSTTYAIGIANSKFPAACYPDFLISAFPFTIHYILNTIDQRLYAILLGIILNAPLKIKDYLRKISNTRRPLFVIHKSKIISEKEGLAGR
jgi:hypothetical protein